MDVGGRALICSEQYLHTSLRALTIYVFSSYSYEEDSVAVEGLIIWIVGIPLQRHICTGHSTSMAVEGITHSMEDSEELL